MKNLLKLLVVFFLLGHYAFCANPDYMIKPRIISAPDGDTIKIWTKEKNVNVRLTGIDKKWGRYVGIFYYKDKSGNYVSINDKMMNTGYCPQYIFTPDSQYLKYR